MILWTTYVDDKTRHVDQSISNDLTSFSRLRQPFFLRWRRIFRVEGGAHTSRGVTRIEQGVKSERSQSAQHRAFGHGDVTLGELLIYYRIFVEYERVYHH